MKQNLIEKIERQLLTIWWEVGSKTHQCIVERIIFERFRIDGWDMDIEVNLN